MLLPHLVGFFFFSSNDFPFWVLIFYFTKIDFGRARQMALFHMISIGIIAIKLDEKFRYIYKDNNFDFTLKYQIWIFQKRQSLTHFSPEDIATISTNILRCIALNNATMATVFHLMVIFLVIWPFLAPEAVSIFPFCLACELSDLIGKPTNILDTKWCGWPQNWCQRFLPS